MMGGIKRGAVLLAIAAAAQAIAPAQAQRPGAAGNGMRPNMPSVEPRRMEADPNAGQRAVEGQFARWNRAHGRPRLLVYWDRTLDDETTTRYRDRASGGSVMMRAPGITTQEYDNVRERERTTGGPDQSIGAADSDDLETSFVSAFIDAGANLADRSALMRKVSTRHGQDDRSDQQYMESLALEAGVAYLVQVSPSYRTTGSGFSFAIKVTHLPTSRVVAQFRTTAQPVAGPERLVAVPGGFQRQRDMRNTPALVGRALAADTMLRLQ